MKIIKKGDKKICAEDLHGWKKRQGKFSKVFECKNEHIPIFGRDKGCHAKIRVSEDDLLLFYWHGTHSKHSYAGFRCPCCGKVNVASPVPKSVWNEHLEKMTATFDGFSEAD